MSKSESLKAYKIFQELIRDNNFIDEILKTENGIDLAKKFNSHGVDLAQIDFSEVCKILTQKIQMGSKTYEIDSVMDSIVPDYLNGYETTVVEFNEADNNKDKI